MAASELLAEVVSKSVRDTPANAAPNPARIGQQIEVE
jgi:hypothetical protein